MTVGELISLLEHVDSDVEIRDSKGNEYASISLFLDQKCYICLELE